LTVEPLLATARLTVLKAVPVATIKVMVEMAI
jgi:hypothetical protein